MRARGRGGGVGRLLTSDVLAPTLPARRAPACGRCGHAHVHVHVHVCVALAGVLERALPHYTRYSSVSQENRRSLHPRGVRAPPCHERAVGGAQVGVSLARKSIIKRSGNPTGRELGARPPMRPRRVHSPADLTRQRDTLRCAPRAPRSAFFRRPRPATEPALACGATPPVASTAIPVPGGAAARRCAPPIA